VSSSGFRRFKGKSGTINPMTERRILENLNPQLHLCENFKSRSEYFHSNKDRNKMSNSAFYSHVVSASTNSEPRVV
jgi:hypothetical protein